jgi:hypothetical protein
MQQHKYAVPQYAVLRIKKLLQTFSSALLSQTSSINLSKDLKICLLVFAGWAFIGSSVALMHISTIAASPDHFARSLEGRFIIKILFKS